MRSIDVILLEVILDNIKNNEKITEVELARMYHCTERTIRRYLKILKDKGIVRLDASGKNRKWIILKWYSN